VLSILAAPCLWITLNGVPIGCRTEQIAYFPRERELRIGTLRVRNPGLSYFPRERRVSVTGTELPMLKNGFE